MTEGVIILKTVQCETNYCAKKLWQMLIRNTLT